jgi:DNA invertase Pin-like site-specific DNA recombinase
MADGKFVAYYRVSTQKQGNSGLSFEAQQAAVENYLKGELIAEYIEIESGRKSDRPKLAEALKLAKRRKATLVIARLDRLARNVAFIATLMESKVEFVAVDFPQADQLTIHIMAAMAEHEARLISERTKAALARLKARGVKLGGCRVSPERHAKISALGREAAAKALRSQRIERERNLRPVIDEIRAGGAKTLREIANELNRRGEETARGRQWTAVQVMRILRNTTEAALQRAELTECKS